MLSTSYQLYGNLISLIKYIMGFLPSCSHVSTIVWLPHLDANEVFRGEASCKLHKNAVCCLEQILETASCKIAAVWFPTSHLTNHPSKTDKSCWILLKKQTNPYLDSYTWAFEYWVTCKDLHLSALHWDWMHFKESGKRDGQQERMPRESQINICYQHDLMMTMCENF